MILKRKSRYVLVRSSERVSLDSRDSALGFLKELERAMGISAYAHAHPKIAKQISYNLFIIKLNRGSEDQFILATSFIKKVNGQATGLQTVKTSGAINNLIALSKKQAKPE